VNLCGLVQQGAPQTRLVLALKDSMCPSRNLLFPVLTYDSYDASQAQGLCSATYLKTPCVDDFTVSATGELTCQGASMSPTTALPTLGNTAPPTDPPAPLQTSSSGAVATASVAALVAAIFVNYLS